MAKTEKTCWNCKHLLSAVGALPPVLCKAYPKDEGVSIEVLSGQHWHEHLFGDEAEPVFFEPMLKGDD